MRKTLVLTPLFFFAASACVTYDNDKGAGFDTGAAGSYHEDPAGDGSAGDSGAGDSGAGDLADPSISLSFAPSQAEQGEAFIGYITADDGFDMDRVSDIYLLGDLEIQSFDSRGDEIVVSLSVDSDATTGPIDLALVLDDQTTFWLEGALTLYEAGSGNSTDDIDSGSGGSGGTSDCP